MDGVLQVTGVSIVKIMFVISKSCIKKLNDVISIPSPSFIVVDSFSGIPKTFWTEKNIVCSKLCLDYN